MRAAAALALLALLAFSPARAEYVAYSTVEPDAGFFIQGGARAVQNATEALYAARLAIPFDAAADNASWIVEELARAAGLPEESEIRLVAAQQANSARLLVEALLPFLKEVHSADLSSARLHVDDVERLLGLLVGVEKATDALRRIDQPVDRLQENVTMLSEELRGKAGERALMILPPTRASLGSLLEAHVLILSADAPVRVSLSLDDAPAVETRMISGREGIATFGIPLDAARLGSHVLSGEALLADGTRLGGSTEVKVERHPTRVAEVDGRHVVLSALEPHMLFEGDGEALRSALRKAVVAVRQEGRTVPLTSDEFDPSRPATLIFEGSDVLLPSETPYAPTEAPASIADAISMALPHLLIVLAVALLLAAAILLPILKRPKRVAATPLPAAAPAARPVAEVPALLESLPVRERVVAAYRLVREGAQRRGVGNPAQTAREWGREVAHSLGRSVEILVQAYERARYSPLPFADDEAQLALSQARAALEAAR